MAQESIRSFNGSGANYSSNPDRIGRDGFLKLRFKRSGPGTALRECRFALPLQALTPLILDDGTAYLMLLNPAGGLIGGDRLMTHIVQEAYTRVCLTTPSSTRVYRTDHNPAVQETFIQLNEGATLEYLPDHVIPHAGARFRQFLRIEMAPGSGAVISDALAAGRLAHGERWNFKEIDARTEVFIRGTPVFINRAKINPQSHPPRQLGAMEEFNYIGGLAAFADWPEDWERVAAAMSAELDHLPQVRGGASAMARGGCLARFLANSAFDLTRATKILWGVAREMVLKLRPFDLRKY